MNAPLLPGFGAPALVPMDSPITSERDRILCHLQREAGQRFSVDASRAIVQHLETHGDTPGEVLTDAVKARGIVPPSHMDDRAFGPVYMRLCRLGIIEKRGSAVRMKGHGTSGGNVWGLVRR